MKLKVGTKTVNLTKNNFLAQGGEGKVFVRDQTAYKIYDDPTKMIPHGKIQDLGVLKLSNIIKPKDIIFKDSNPIGYAMDYIDNTYALCQLFPKSFWKRNSFDIGTALDLIKDMNQTLQHIHSKNIVVVDLNEMNILIDKSLKKSFWIDVDSWQTPNFPATAIMDSIRDRHSRDFSFKTDWFSFAIVTFQLLVGIHPYKGKHQKVKKMEERMLQNISVFNPDVRLPKTCRPIASIPDNLRNWYKSVFEDGLRDRAPVDFLKAIVIAFQPTFIKGNNNFDINLIFEYDGEIIHHLANYVDSITVTKKGLYYNSVLKPLGGIKAKSPMTVFFDNEPVMAWLDNDKLNFFNITHRKHLSSFKLNISGIMNYNNRVYAHCGDTILEFSNMGPIITSRIASSTMEKTTQVFSGVIFQNLIGLNYASFFEDKTCHQIKIEELSEYKIIEAKFIKSVLMVVGFNRKTGLYDKFVFRFNKKWEYDTRKVENIVPSGLNFIVLDNNICVHINENEEIEVFGRKDSINVKKISDSSIHGNMMLYQDGQKVLISEGNKIYQIKMK